MKECSDEGCHRPKYCRGLCHLHYYRALRHRKFAPLTPIDRFFAHVEKQPSGCWHWTGYINHLGYGTVRVNRRGTSAHRAAWEMLRGPIAKGLDVDHLCRNPRCVNPDHLEPVTHRENILRGDAPAAHFARRTHCAKGHPFDAENTKIIVSRGSRARRCMTCERHRDRLRWPMKAEKRRSNRA